MAEPIRRVAVTGAAGYVARALIRGIEREESIEHVLALDTREPTERYSSKVVFRRHDVTAPVADLLSAHGTDAVVHLAFILNPGRDRRRVREANVGGVANVLDACAKAGVRHLVYVSSTTVYGAHPDNPRMLTEDSPIRPVKGFQYAEDKVSAEELVAQFSESRSATATVLRACPVLGPNVDNFIGRSFSKPFLVGVRGYDPAMQFLHEDDLADTLLLCLTERVSGIYNTAGVGTIDWSEMAEVAGSRLVMLPAPLAYAVTDITWKLRLQNASRACGLDFVRYRWTAGTEKIERELGVRPRHSSRDAWEAFVRRRRGAALTREAL